MPLSSRLARIAAQHEDLEGLLSAHLAALISPAWSEAPAHLVRFSQLLEEHMQVEDDVLLPAYDELRDEPSDATATSAGPLGSLPWVSTEIFRTEHARLRLLLAALKAALTDALSTDLSPAGHPSPTALLAYLEEAFRFKHLLEHHDRREENVLYPRLHGQGQQAGLRAWASACAPDDPARNDPEGVALAPPSSRPL